MTRLAWGSSALKRLLRAQNQMCGRCAMPHAQKINASTAAALRAHTHYILED